VSRRLRVPAVSAVGAVALVVLVGGIAEAGTARTPASVTGGTGTVFMTKSYIADMAAGNILISPVNPLSVTSQNTFTTTVWELDGGDADLAQCTGTVHLDGGSLVTNTVTGQQMPLTDLRFDLATDSLDYTLTTPAGAMTIKALDLGGVQFGYVHGDEATYSASKLTVDPAAGAALDSALGTTAFTDTGSFGAFTTTFELSRPEGSGLAYCG
jgi:hypothetical protein